MSFREKTEMELIQLATVSSDLELLKSLYKSEIMNVRRALARNINIDSELAEKLVFDPVLNVAYMASKNPKCSFKREFDENILTPCVKCEVDERKLDCMNCSYLNN